MGNLAQKGWFILTITICNLEKEAKMAYFERHIKV